MTREGTLMRKARAASPEVLRDRAEAVVRARRDSGVESPGGSVDHEIEVLVAQLELQGEALREAQRELEASRAANRDLFDSVPIALIAIARDDRIKAANNAATELLGIPQKELAGMRLSQFVAETEVEALDRHRRDVSGSREPVRTLFTLVSPTGGSRSVIFESACTNPTTGEWRVALLVTEAETLERRLERRSDRPSIHGILPANLAVVVVADDSEVRRIAVDYFRSIGCEAIDAVDGFEALEALKSNRDRPIVVLADAGLRSLGRPEFVVAARAVVPSVGIARTALRSENTGLAATPNIDLDCLYDAVVRALGDSRG
jgi:PAS domain S-box-containing protein